MIRQRSLDLILPQNSTDRDNLPMIGVKPTGIDFVIYRKNHPPGNRDNSARCQWDHTTQAGYGFLT